MMRLSISKIKTFRACRRMYELRYKENLIPAVKPDALTIGKNYHALLEGLNNVGNLLPAEDDWSKELAMATAYKKYIYPKFKVVEAEKWFEYDLGGDDKLVGCVDGIAEDGYIVEHKTTGSEITPQYEYNLLWDEQILAYMLVTGARKVWYTVCRKPTIRQKKDETDEEFFHRMVEWYDTDTDSKIRLLEITRTDAEIEQFRTELNGMLRMMKYSEEMAGNSFVNTFYRNTCHCNMYGRRCEYSSVCLHYDPNQEYVEFVKGDGEYEPSEN